MINRKSSVSLLYLLAWLAALAGLGPARQGGPARGPGVLFGNSPSWASAQDTDEWKKRDAWQRPEEVMDALGARPGSVIADVGCGRGYFTFHLAGRVGEQGKVYAVDVKDDVLEEVRHRAAEERLGQIETIHSEPDDPHLPEGALDGILVVNAYHEFHQYDAMLQGFRQALKPGGRLVIIDQSAALGEPRSSYFRRHKMPEAIERADLEHNGFRFVEKRKDFDDPTYGNMYFLIYEKP